MKGENQETPGTFEGLSGLSGHIRTLAEESLSNAIMGLPIDPDTAVSAGQLKEVMAPSTDLVFNEVPLPKGGGIARLVYFRTLTDAPTIAKEVEGPLLKGQTPSGPGRSPVATYGEAADALLRGHCVILLPGQQAMRADVHLFPKRAVERPQIEMGIYTPQESFDETLRDNLALLRRWLPLPGLVMQSFTVGSLTRTDIIMVYIRGVADETLVDEVTKRVSEIKMDGVRNLQEVEEMVSDSPWSPLPQLLTTERPDRVVAMLLEGRVAILADRQPMALVAPVTFFDLLQTASSYDSNWLYATFIRFLRMATVAVAVFLPSLYLAVVTFNPELLPPKLAMSIAVSRVGIPFPAIVEVLLIELALEILREAAMRASQSLGQTIGVVGALILGTTAVQAGLVSTIMVVIVGATAIANFVIPDYRLAVTVRVMRYIVILAANVFGLYGMTILFAVFLGHVQGLNSFGVPYFRPLAPFLPSKLSDAFVRLPATTRRSARRVSAAGRQPE